MYTFLNNNNVIYNLQFGFRQQYSTSHALINITENIRKALDDGNIGCRVFVDLEKAFDTVDHQTLLAKLNYYGIRGVSNDWFKSYLSNRNQYVSINGYESGLVALNCSVPQGSVLGPLLLLLYINDLNQAIKICKVHHFADDTNLLCLSNYIKKLYKLVNIHKDIFACLSSIHNIISLSCHEQVCLSGLRFERYFSHHHLPDDGRSISRNVAHLNILVHDMINLLYKLVNADLKHLVNWLNANKISLNVKKTEMVIFKSKQNKFEGDLKTKLCGKRLYPT